MHQLDDDRRLMLVKSLDLSIQDLLDKMDSVRQRTHDDYATRIRVKRVLNTKFDLDEAIRDDLTALSLQIKEHQALRDSLNKTSNHLLIVPNYIKLTLSN